MEHTGSIVCTTGGCGGGVRRSRQRLYIRLRRRDAAGGRLYMGELLVRS